MKLKFKPQYPVVNPVLGDYPKHPGLLKEVAVCCYTRIIMRRYILFVFNQILADFKFHSKLLN